MHIACEECGGERFHLIIKDDGHTELVCYNHGDHLAVEASGDGAVKISGADPEREYEDALAAQSQALAEAERTSRLVDRARIAYERHLERLAP